MEDFVRNSFLPVIPLRGLVIFPLMNLHFDIGRAGSLAALKIAEKEGSKVLLLPQRDASEPNPGYEQLLSVGTVAEIRVVRKEDGNAITRVSARGLYRVEVHAFSEQGGALFADVEPLPQTDISRNVFETYKSSILQAVNDFAAVEPKLNKEVVKIISSLDDPDMFIDTVCGVLVRNEQDRQRLLEERNAENRLDVLSQVLATEIELVKLDRKISGKVKKNIEQSQKEYYLREQIKAISEELGDNEDEVESYAARIREKKMPPELEEKALKELFRLRKMQGSSPEAANIRTYCDWICDLPWSEKTEDNSDLALAMDILNEDHFGLEKVKERIVDYIAVNHLTKKIKGPILCFVGPPGVGKTSIAKSIARALNRNFVRMSLGGVRDEAEIRGHRRTYIGAIPGRILYCMKQAGSTNPVFLLDEIDKMSSDFRGDPASAMLEVLDPEQNNAFRDHFLEMDYDLSQVMFICTANQAEAIPAPLYDRMEVIQLTGYTEDEKREIARRYLLPKQAAENGLQADTLTMSDETLNAVIEQYTRESGVRNLERHIGTVCRKIARKTVENGSVFRNYEVSEADLTEYLGAPRFHADEGTEKDEVGAVNGLAWTAVGGTTLTVEVTLMPGKGDILLTGQLGDVMKESARTAFSLVRSRAEEYGIDPKLLSEKDVHIHVPEGAVPKDGPSAGVTMATALLSVFTGKRVRHDVAMTGEITLRGKVLAIGGLKEKTLAALRAGMTTVIIPKANRSDMQELPKNVLERLQFVLAEDVQTVFDTAFVK